MKTPEFEGAYRRRVCVTTNAGVASADMEDDPHRFGVDIAHNGKQVTLIAGRALRTPWTTCAAAEAVLQALRNTPLLHSPFDVLRQVNQRLHCTHLLDMAALAISGAARGHKRRIYDVRLDLSAAGAAVDRRRGTVSLNGGAPEDWDLEDGIIRSPAQFAGLELARASDWQAERAPLPDDKEMIFVMRRAALVSGGSRFDLDAMETAGEMHGMIGSCFTFQPSRADKAGRNFSSGRKFGHANELLDDMPGR